MCIRDRGYTVQDATKQQQSIEKALFGTAEALSAICWRATRVHSLSPDALDHALSFAISPHAMSSYCAVSQGLRDACWRRSSWAGTVVDTPPKWRPAGARAHVHYKLWELCRGVAVSQWQMGSCSFLMSRYKPWQWSLVEPGQAWHECRGHRLLISRNPVQVSNVNVQIHVKGATDGKLVLGVADTNCKVEIMRLYLDKRTRQRRGPAPLQDVDLCFYYCAFGESPRRSFAWNGRPYPSDEPAPSLAAVDGRVVTFGVTDRFQLGVNGRVVAQAPFEHWHIVNKDDYHYAVAIVEGKREPCVELRPFLNRRDAG